MNQLRYTFKAFRELKVYTYSVEVRTIESDRDVSELLLIVVLTITDQCSIFNR